MDKENNRKRGFESRNVSFKRSTKNRESNLIIGSTTQNEICYLMPILSVFGKGLNLEFNYIISRPLALNVFEDLTQFSEIKQLNHILTGYFYIFLSRLQFG